MARQSLAAFQVLRSDQGANTLQSTIVGYVDTRTLLDDFNPESI